METKLKSVLKNLTLRLAFKAAGFGALLFFAGLANFGFFSSFLFLAGAVFLYTRPLFRTVEFLPLLFLLSIVSLKGAKLVDGTDYFLPAVLFASFLFFLLLGVKDFILIRRVAWQRFLNCALAFSVFLIFFYYAQEFFALRLVLLFLAALFLLKNLFKNRVFYWLIAFFLLQCAWVLSLLPIGFINAAVLLLLAYFILIDLTSHHLEGELTKRRILTDVSIFVILTIIVLAFSKWGL